ncbi:hypothetical protein, unlikely [Trypanosoma congolense IL3000]|uniref:Uncharacterized protein n=1 Tax=Trypanosoma congolense (strain IL3000) TaxID=1068625 RepID=F9WCR8_TRYCI|nr:hypothetical protein, unlikely [Trypanosoma congolense IL3000]
MVSLSFSRPLLFIRNPVDSRIQDAFDSKHQRLIPTQRIEPHHQGCDALLTQELHVSQITRRRIRQLPRHVLENVPQPSCIVNEPCGVLKEFRHTGLGRSRVAKTEATFFLQVLGERHVLPGLTSRLENALDVSPHSPGLG